MNKNLIYNMNYHNIYIIILLSSHSFSFINFFMFLDYFFFQYFFIFYLLNIMKENCKESFFINHKDIFDDGTIEIINKYKSYCKIIYNCIIVNNIDFFKICYENKLSFEQEILYLSLASKRFEICDILRNCGCLIDHKCITLSCVLFQHDVIEYCLKYNIHPGQEDIKLLLTKNFNNESDELLSSEYFNYKFQDFLNNNIYNDIIECLYLKNININKIEIFNWFTEKYGYFYKNSHFLINDDKELCINYLIENDICLSKSNLFLCKKLKIDFFQKKSSNINLFCDLLINELTEYGFIKFHYEYEKKKKMCGGYVCKVLSDKYDYDDFYEGIILDNNDIKKIFDFENNKNLFSVRNFKNIIIKQQNKNEIKTIHLDKYHEYYNYTQNLNKDDISLYLFKEYLIILFKNEKFKLKFDCTFYEDPVPKPNFLSIYECLNNYIEIDILQI